MLDIDVESQRLASLRAIASGMLRLKWLRDAARFEITMYRHGLALKAGFKPDQPRVPGGNREGGQWTGEGGSSGGGGSQGNKPDKRPTEQPDDRPPNSRERTAILKQVARRILQTGETVVAIARASAWLQTYSAQIESYNDPPRSLEELQQRASTARSGYDKHHIVEQTQAEKDGFTREAIDAPENRAQIPRMKHWDINEWYQSANPDYGGETPRDYLRGRSWEVRRAVGLEALRIHGVLKP